MWKKEILLTIKIFSKEYHSLMEKNYKERERENTKKDGSRIESIN